MIDQNEGDNDQERCMALAAPLLPDFHEIWHHALAVFKKIPPEVVAEHDETTVANIIRAHAYAEVARRFEGKKGFKILRLQRLVLLLDRDATIWRFKRVDSSGRHANVPTDQQVDFDDQLPLAGLPPAAVRLTSGYQLDSAGYSIERVIVSRPIGSSIAWASQINLASGVASWTDITPKRFVGTSRIDFRSRKK